MMADIYLKKRKTSKKPIVERRRTLTERLIFGLVFVIFFAYSASLILTLLWGVMNSLKTQREFVRDTISLPVSPQFSNYLNAFKLLQYSDTTFIGMFINSLWFSVGSALIGAFASSCTSFVFAKYNIKFKEFWFTCVLFTMMIPIYGSSTMQYKIVYSLHLNDSPLYLITQIGGFGQTFLIMYAYWKGIDSAYMEASFMDGGGRFYTFLRIMLPLAKPPLFAIVLMAILAGWNDYGTALLYLTKMPTLATGLYCFLDATTYAGSKPTYFAGVFLSLMPAVLIFVLTSKKIMNNLLLGGLKG